MSAEFTQIAIKFDLAHRPMAPLASPFGRCHHCYYVYAGVPPTGICPTCGSALAAHLPWPSDELMELWKEQIDNWNRRKVEAAVIMAAIYFESSVFHLLYLGMGWLDPELNWLDAPAEEIPGKMREIWRRLNAIRSRRATDKALSKLFGRSGIEMLKSVEGDKDAGYYLDQYRELTKHRNYIVHQGRRYTDTSEDGKVVRVRGEV
jgi:hypothetical protein